MDHLALAVSSQERSRRFYETYLGFTAEPAPRLDGVLMLHDSAGFALALGETSESISLPTFLHFTGLPSALEARCLTAEIHAGRMTATTLRRIATLARRTGCKACTTRECDARLGRDRPRLRANFRSSIQAFRDRLVADGVEIVGEWGEPDYVSVKFRDPDGYVVEVSWEPEELPE